MIDREQARRVAAAVVAPKKIGEVVSLGEIRFRPPLIYGFPEKDLMDFWIAYVEFDPLFGLRSSHVVLVRKTDGSVVYSGSANDEG